MKKKNIIHKKTVALSILVTILFLIFSQIAVSQNNMQSVVMSEIIAALKKGNNEDLSARFDSSIKLTIDTQTGTYTAADAKRHLSDFFEKNAVENFIIVHQGGSEQSCFVIGTLKTANGSFRIYILMRGKTLAIQQIIIGKEQSEH